MRLYRRTRQWGRTQPIETMNINLCQKQPLEGCYQPKEMKVERIFSLLDTELEGDFTLIARRAWKVAHELDCYRTALERIYLRSDFFSTILERVLRMEYPGVEIYRLHNGEWKLCENFTDDALLKIREGFEDFSGWERPSHYAVRGYFGESFSRSMASYYRRKI